MTLKPLVTLSALGFLGSSFMPWIDVPVVGATTLYDIVRPIVDQYLELSDLGVGEIANQVMEALPWPVLLFLGGFVAAALALVASILHLGPRLWAFLAGGSVALTGLVLYMRGQEALAELGLPLDIVTPAPADLWALMPMGPKVYAGCGLVLLLLALFAPASPRYRA